MERMEFEFWRLNSAIGFEPERSPKSLSFGPGIFSGADENGGFVALTTGDDGVARLRDLDGLIKSVLAVGNIKISEQFFLKS